MEETTDLSARLRNTGPKAGKSRHLSGLVQLEWARVPYADPERRRAVIREHYAKNKIYYFDRNKRRRAAARAYLASQKEKLRCEECGESHIACLDFHHLDPAQKDISVGEMISRGDSVRKIAAEIDKCAVLCANCHRKLHYEEKAAA